MVIILLVLPQFTQYHQTPRPKYWHLHQIYLSRNSCWCWPPAWWNQENQQFPQTGEKHFAAEKNFWNLSSLQIAIKSSKNRCWRKSIIIGRWEILDSLIRKSSKWKSLSCIKLNLKYEVFTERSKRPFNAHRRNTYIGHAVSILVSEYVLYLWYIWFWTWIYFLVNRQIYFIPVFTYVCLPPGFKVYPVSFIYLLI